jgi:hypothetical protein
MCVSVYACVCVYMCKNRGKEGIREGDEEGRCIQKHRNKQKSTVQLRQVLQIQ